MKNAVKKIVTILITVLSLSLLLFGCADKNGEEEAKSYRFTAPEGTPALAILRLPVDDTEIDGVKMEYEIVSPSNIASEMSSKKSDLVIMPVNAGANLIKQGADYKLVSIAVSGSLFMVGRTENGTLTFDDIIGKKVACIGKTGVPGLIFRHLLTKNNIIAIEEGTPNAENREVLVQYVADGPAAKTLLMNSSEGVDFAVVGEPAATTFLSAAPLNLNAKMNLQEEYKKANNNTVETYPQAGLFVKSEITENTAFMNKLFDALKQSKDWTVANPTQVTAFAKENLYESAAFPANSIPNCAIGGEKLTVETKAQIIAFLKNVAPKDGSGNVNDWDAVKDRLF